MKIRMNILALSLLIVALASSSCGGPAASTSTEKKLQAPSDVAVSGTPGTDHLSFSWTAVDGATEYRYRLLEGNTLSQQASVKSTSVSFDGLKPATSYNFDVKSVDGSFESPWSSRVHVMTATEQTEPDPDSGDESSAIGDAAAVLAAMNLSEQEGVRAFPGASGGGSATVGGRGGKIFHVTNLNDSGEGSLRAAVEAKGARTVVFDVSGNIELTKRLEIKNGDITIAGQTAPGDGVCLKGHNVRINASNVIIRFLRFRMGDVNNVEDDALNCYVDNGISNVIVDHCSMSWSTDECGSFYGIDGFTLQYCILSESLRISVHGKGQHGYGGIWGGAHASFHHNLLAHHDSRNPRFDHDYVSGLKGPVHYYNNVVYNWGANSSYGGESGSGQQPRQINMVNNYYKPGPATSANSSTRLVNPTTKCSNCNKDDQYDVVPGSFYLSGNIMYGSEEVTSNNRLGVRPDDKSLVDKVLADSYQGTEPERIQTAADAFETVLATAGASLRRDKVDERIVKETREGTSTYEGSKGSRGGLIDSQSDVGAWPELKSTQEEIARVKDSDGDGIPDYYEKLFGLDASDASDASAYSIDSKLKRYSNFELYLHYLVREIVQ